MRKDPTEFRERFLRWKKGELVYENGLALPAYEDGKDANDVPLYTPSIDDREQPGYRKYLWELSKARRNAFLKEYGDAAPIKNYYEDFLNNSEGVFNYRRWYNLASPAERKYGLKKGLAHWADADGKTSLHPSFSIESPYSGYKNPYNPKGIIGGKWIDDDHYEFSDSQINNDWPINKTLDEFDRSRKEEGSNTYAYYKGGIMLHEPTIIGKMPKYKDGLTPHKKSEVNTNLAIYNPEEDLYTGRYTLPEVTVTGDKSKRVYHSHAPRTSGMSKNQYKLLTGDLLGAMTTGMNVLSPSLWWGAVRDANGLQDGFNRLMRGNSGFVTENFEREHPYISIGANLIGDAAILGGPSGVKNLNQSVNKSNFYRAHKVSNAINAGVKENPVITAYNRNPATKDLGTLWDYQSYLNKMFPNSKIKDVLWHGSKVRNLQSFSTDAIGSNAPIKGSTGMYLAPERYTAASYGRNGDVYPVLLNTENPFVTDQTFGGISKNGVNVTKISPKVKNTKLAQNDAVIAQKRGEVAFFNPDNAIVLGSNRDLQGFKSYAFKNKLGTNNQTVRTRVGDIEIDDPNLLYHLDMGDYQGAFSTHGAYVEDGFLFPGTPKEPSATPYSWWNKGKPYATAINGQPMTRLMTTTEDVPGMLHVRSQNYPIGQWDGKRGFVRNSEYVNPNPVNVSNNIYNFDPNYGWRKFIAIPPTLNL